MRRAQFKDILCKCGDIIVVESSNEWTTCSCGSRWIRTNSDEDQLRMEKEKPEGENAVNQEK